MIKKLAKFFFKEIIYNGHLQSFGAVNIVYISTLFLLGKIAGFDLLIITYAIFQSIYTFDRYKDINHDKETNRQRTRHLEKFLNKMPLVLLTLVGVVIVGNLVSFNFASFMFSITVIALGISYPVFFKKLTKKIPLFKNFFVSSVFALMTIFPLIYYPLLPNNPTIVIFLFFFVFLESLVSQIILDSKDVVTDKKNGLLTLPVILGKKKSLTTLRNLSLVFESLFLILLFFVPIDLTFAMLVIINFLVNHLSITMIYENKQVGYAICAGKFFFWFLITLII